MKSGIEQLREEKYRFTIETQGLVYTSKDCCLATQDDGTAWSEDDSDRDVSRKKSPHLAQRMARELTRVLREGRPGGFTDEALERLLAGSLQSGSDLAGYDVAKDYIKQVLGQLYGEDNATRSTPAETGAGSKHCAAEPPANASPAPNRFSSLDSSSGGSLGASGPGPSLSNPMQTVLPTAGGGAMAPPWTTAIGCGTAEVGSGVTSAPAARGANDDEMERPRPRPHHGRIKEQLDLLQNADQLAAIISVATTAATTAAAAAVKQTMQTAAPLPPGAYARMHATGQPMHNLPIVSAAMGRAAQGTLRRQSGAAADALGDESPDPQPQQRHGALVSPHQRRTPMVMTRRQEGGTSAPGVAQGVGISRGEHQEQEEAGSVLGPSSREVQLRRQRLRWSQRRGHPLGPTGASAGAADGGRGAASPGELHSVNTAGTGSSNLRVVRLGTPRVTARTPTPVRLGVPNELRAGFQPKMEADLVPIQGLEPDHDGTMLFASEDGTPAGNRTRIQRPDRPALIEAELGSGTQPIASAGTATVEVAPRLVTAAHALPPARATLRPVPLDNDMTTVQQQQPAEDPFAAGCVSPGGLFVAGGESVFVRSQMVPVLSAPNREVDPNRVAAKGSGPAPPRPRRAALPEDMQDAFRSTLSFISDPGIARAQQRPAPSWAALEDVEERKQAQREAEELLGGAFDYVAIKRELEQAKRTSRLLQQAAGPLTPPASMGQVLNGGLELHAAGSRPRPARGTRTAIGMAANVAPQPRGDFEGLLPPPHSVWDVDEAWVDLDQFTKAVEAEVAYRAAAAGTSRRGSPARTQAGPRTIATAATTVSGKTIEAGKIIDRLPAGRAISTATAVAAASSGGKEQSDATVHTGGRKRTASPGPETTAQRLMTGAVERSPSPPRIARKTQASGPFRIAFGRRVDEPPKAAEGRTPRARSGSPPKARASHGGTRSRSRSRTRKHASTPVPVAASPSSLSAGDAVSQVLNALASVLLSDGDEAEDESKINPGDEMVVAAAGDRPGLIPSLTDAVPHLNTREAETECGPTVVLAGDATRAEGTERTASSPSLTAVQGDLVAPPLPPQHAHQQQLVARGSDPLGYPAEPNIARDNSQENSRNPVRLIQAPSGTLGTSDSSTVTATTLVGQVGAQPWPNTTAASRPRFQYVIDTAHPPITRLPTWAASATAAEGAPAAYAAALGTAPTGLGFSTHARRRQQPPVTTPVPFTTMVPQPANTPIQPSNPFEIRALSQAGGDGSIIAANKVNYTQSWEHQQPQQQPQLVFPAPGDLPSSTHILPQQAVVAVLAAADVSVAARRAPDPNQQWEGAVMRALEDEVVGRLAVMQLAAQGEGPMVSPQDVAGVLPPLLDMELSRRLVCDVLRDNLRSLIVGQQQQWPPADVERQGPTLDEEAVGAPTLEEPEGQTPSLLTQTTAVAHPVAEIIPRDDPLPTTASPGRPTGLAIAALSSVPTPTETIAPGAAASVVQHALSEPHPVTAWQKQGTAVLPVFAAASAGPAEEQSPTKSQGTQAHGVQGRGVQAHGAEARGVQAHGIVEARAVQAHGMEARGIQAAGVQERGTQAAGIMDRSSQADPPVPHYLLQAALAAGLSYGAGPSLPTNIQTTGLGAGQPVLAQDGAALSMTRPFYLVPADGSQLPSTVSLYGPASGLAFPPYARGEGSRPPLNIPGLSKLRDSSDIDSSTDSMGRHLQAPGARARAAALEALRFASRGSLDSDDGLLQRSYAQLELASLTARPVRLDHHMTSLEDSQLPQRSETGLEQPSSGTTQHPSIDRNDSDERGADASGTGGSGSQVQGRTSQANGMDDGNPIVGNGRPGSEAYRSERGPASHAVGGHAERSGTVPPRYLSRRSSLTSYGSADEPRSGSGGAERESRPRCSDASNGTPIARSQGHSWSALVGAVEHVSSPSQPTTSHAMSLDSCGQQADGVGPRGSGQGSALPSGELSTLSVEQGSVAIVRTPSVYHEGASGLQPAFTVAEAAVTPAVGDDELVREGDFADDDPDEVHSVYFESSLDQVCGTPEAGKTSGTTGANAADDTSEAPAGSGAASTSFGAGTVQKQPRAMVGWTPQSDADEPLGGQCSAGAGEAGNFTLSDDELMDEAEVTRVLAEEDATEAAEDELEDVDEQDEELQLLESQIVQQESSLEVGFGLSAINEPVASGPQEHDSVAVQSSEESPSQGAELVFRGTDSGNGSERGGESAVGSRQTSAMQLSEQSRIVSLEPSTGSGGPDTLGVASRTDSSAAERPRPGSVADVESTTAVSLQGGNKASDGGTYSDSSGRRRMSTGAAHGASSPGSSDAEGASELPKSAQDPNHLDIENQPYRGAAADADAGEIVLRTSLERLAFAGLAPMGLLQAGAGVGSSGLMRTTAAPVPLTSQQPQISGTGTMVAMSQRRSALAPLQAASVQPATSQADNGLALQPHDSPSKPPSLANYQGPTRQLWRPPSAQQTQDPLWTSSETVMASSEASGPTSDPLSRTFLNAGRRIPTLGTDGALAAAVARGTGDSIESSVDLLTSIDSVPAIAARPLHTIAGATLPHLLGRKEQAAGSHSTRGIEFSHSAGSDVESDEEGQVADGVQQGSMNIYKSEETGTGRGSSRREGAVFRLRQYGARRRKLMQQIGVNDPLLLSSASSLSTDSSTVSESNGDEVPMLLLRGLRGSTRRMP